MLYRRMKRALFEWRFRTTHWRSPQAIRRYQSSRLRQLLVHSASQVRFYKNLFKEVGVDVESIRSVDDLSRLPVTSKSMYISRPVDDYLDASQPTYGTWRHTSGTSGKPLSILVSGLLGIPRYHGFLVHRFYFWDHPWVHTLKGVRIARIKIAARGYPNRLALSVRQFLEDTEESVRTIAAFKPDILESYPSILLELARAIEQQPALPRITVRYLSSVGEMLTPAARAYLEKQFMCEVYDRYGAEEVGPVATECAQHNGMHINVESTIIEIVDPEGNPLPPGERGRVIATDLLNYKMPFIRYDVGDQGILDTRACACGLRTPRLFVEGRYSATLTAGQRVIHHLEFDGALDSFMNQIVQYQVAKCAATAFEVRVVPGAAFSEETERKILHNIQVLVGEGASVSIKTMATLPITERGKSKIVVDESV